jgi:membrane protein DedA with SNARE-associated domain
MSKTELILLISHIGFILWFYVGYRFGETKAKKRWLKNTVKRNDSRTRRGVYQSIHGSTTLYRR